MHYRDIVAPRTQAAEPGHTPQRKPAGGGVQPLNGPMRIAQQALAAFLAACVFTLDTVTDIEIDVAVLYIVPLVVGSYREGRAVTLVWMGASVFLSILSFTLTHLPTTPITALLRLFVAIIAITVASALIVKRLVLQQTREALLESRARLQLMADSVPQLIWQSGPDGRIDFLNKRWTAMTGGSIEEGLHEDGWLGYIHPDDTAALVIAWDKARAEGGEFRHQARLRQADGSYHWTSTVAYAFRSADGEVIRWYGGTSDVDSEFRANEALRELKDSLERQVAERTRELTNSERRYRSIFEQTHIALFEQDLRQLRALVEGLRAQGVADLTAYAKSNPDFARQCMEAISTIAANGATIRLMGARVPDDVLGSAARFFSEAEGTILRMATALFDKAPSFQELAALTGCDGRHITVLFGSVFPTEEDGYARVVAGMVDVTERERAHQMLHQAREELAKTNRAATLGALSASIAHDLNQPVGALVMDAETGLRWLRRDPPDLAAATRALERIVSNGHRASEIVGRAREKLVSGRRRIRSVDLPELVEETLGLLGGELQAGGATAVLIRQAPVPLVEADRTELQQVLVNLIINAVQAMSETEVAKRRVEIHLQPTAEGQARISVMDNGPGIAAENLAHLFDPFFSTKVDGMGMGLAICRSTVGAFGGRLAAENREGGGAVFHFALPPADMEAA